MTAGSKGGGPATSKEGGPATSREGGPATSEEGGPAGAGVQGAPGVNSTAASLLGFLHDGPQTGWDLVARAERTIGPYWSLTRSQVYRELGSMADQGLISPGPTGRRDARPYAITEAGRAEFARWAAAGPGAATIRLPLLLMVTLGRHIDPAVLAATLRAQREHQATMLAGYLAVRTGLIAAGADPFLLATLDYGIAATRTTIRWLDRLPAEITRRQADRPGG